MKLLEKILYCIFILFITLSAVESHWTDLLKILKKTVDGIDIADVSELNFINIS